MKLALASDHAGFELKSAVAAHLERRGITFVDFGCGPGEAVDYVDFAVPAAEAVSAGDCEGAVLFCGTGIGMAIAANKVPGVRAAACWDTFTASVSRRHNNANCLALGGRVLTPGQAAAIVDAWLEAPFEGGRHERRVGKIAALESANFKTPKRRRARHVPAH